MKSSNNTIFNADGGGCAGPLGNDPGANEEAFVDQFNDVFLDKAYAGGIQNQGADERGRRF